jgi:hypothetical protein
MKTLPRIVSIAMVAAAAGSTSAVDPALRPFPVDWHSPADSPASVAFLLDAPAGKGGFLRVDAGHLVTPDGRRFRIWGMNITGKATLPAKEDAPQLAAHLARVGVNCIRFHFLDSASPRGLIDAGRDDSRALDPVQLDRLDFFVAQLKQRGIYSDLNLNVARAFKAGDGVPDAELLGYAKALTYFHPRLLELQKEYARQLLTHRNPYTGRAYCDEPAVALVELVNENSLVESWFSGRLLGRNLRKHPGTWTDIPESYEKELTALYNDWLREHLPKAELARIRAAAGVGDGPLPRLQPDQFAAAPKERFHTEAAFYMDLEERYFREMGRYLRDDLKVHALRLGTSDHNHGRSGYPLLASTSQLDVVDGHVYWQHPRYIEDRVTGRHVGFSIPNTPMVNDPLHSSAVELSRSAMAGKPYTVSEVNEPFPHEYACEQIPILAACAAQQDWDGVFWYTLGHDDIVNAGAAPLQYFDLAPDPVKMAQLAAGALVFLRADVRPAGETVPRSYSREQVIESIRLPRSEAPYFTPGFSLATPLLHATRIATLAAPAAERFEPSPAPTAGPIRSDTGEICWRGWEAKQGQVVIQTARSEALVGFNKASRQATANLGLEVDNPFSAVTLSALDERPIASSHKLLLTAAARVANSGMQWNAGRTTLEKWGHAPACIEPVTGRILLRNLDHASRVQVQPLTGAGSPLGRAAAATRSADGWRFSIGDPAAIAYVISID